MSQTQARIVELGHVIPGDQDDELETAREDLSNAFDELWRTEDVVGRETQLARRIDRVWRQLDELVKHLEPGDFASDDELSSATRDVQSSPSAAAKRSDGREPRQQELPIARGEAKRFAAARDRRAWCLVLLAFAIAVATGLKSEYLGEAFGGSYSDYVSLFLWGVTTKVALDLVLTSLDSLSMIRLPNR